jgi:hypothetical protein
MFGLQPRPVYAEVIAWLAYAIPFGLLVLLPRRPKPNRDLSEQPSQPALAV